MKHGVLSYSNRAAGSTLCGIVRCGQVVITKDLKLMECPVCRGIVKGGWLILQ